MVLVRDIAEIISFLSKRSVNLKGASSRIESAQALSTTFRKQQKAVNAAFFIISEHNRSELAALKKGVDVDLLPHCKSAWNGKLAVVAGASTGAIKRVGANHDLRQSLVLLNRPMPQQPEADSGAADILANEALFDAIVAGSDYLNRRRRTLAEVMNGRKVLAFPNR
jgi:NAD(P)H-dependent FMN reductase